MGLRGVGFISRYEDVSRGGKVEEEENTGERDYMHAVHVG